MLNFAFISPLEVCANGHILELMNKLAAGFVVIFTFVAVNADSINGCNSLIIAADALICSAGRSKSELHLICHRIIFYRKIHYGS